MKKHTTGHLYQYSIFYRNIQVPFSSQIQIPTHLLSAII